MFLSTLRTAGVAALALSALFANPAVAEDASSFYSGKTVKLYIGFGPGGSYDLYGRLVAKYIGNHIPGHPTVVPMNMEGAGSLRLANWLYNAAPKDGTVIATISRAVPFDPLIGADQSAAQFDPTKFTWLGSANNEVSTCVSWDKSGVKTFDDLKTKGMVMGGDGPTADAEQYARVMNGVFSTKINIVSGYSGSNEINLAMERGEVQGRCGWSWSSVQATHPDWVKNGTIDVLVQMGAKKSPDLPNTPQLSDLATADEQKQILRLILARQPLGRPFLAPPKLPADRAEALRKAFDETMTDPQFLADAKQAKLDVDPISGAEIQSLLKDIVDTPKPVASKARELIAPK